MSTHASATAGFGSVLRHLIVLIVFGAAFILSAGCARGSVVSASVGPLFGVEGGAAGVTASLEWTWMAHERPEPVRPDSRERYGARGPRNLLGIGLMGAGVGGWDSSGGGHVAAVAGIDYFPFLGPGGFVNFGGAVGFGYHDGAWSWSLLAPRLGFALTPWSWGSARLGMGLRLQCAFGPASPDGCGPAVTLYRLQLGE